jgi:anti-sigma B factor antagonist
MYGTSTHEEMSFRLDHRGEVTVITVAGEVDIFTASRLREALVEQIAAGQVHFVVNMERVTCLDSTAAAVLIGAWWRVRDHGGWLDLAGVPEPIRRIFHVTCLTRDIAFYETPDEALRASAHSHPRCLKTR